MPLLPACITDWYYRLKYERMKRRYGPLQMAIIESLAKRDDQPEEEPEEIPYEVRSAEWDAPEPSDREAELPEPVPSIGFDPTGLHHAEAKQLRSNLWYTLDKQERRGHPPHDRLTTVSHFSTSQSLFSDAGLRVLVRACPNLVWLDVFDNHHLNDIEPLRNLKRLRSIVFSEGFVENLAPVMSHATLESVIAWSSSEGQMPAYWEIPNLRALQRIDGECDPDAAQLFNRAPDLEYLLFHGLTREFPVGCYESLGALTHLHIDMAYKAPGFSTLRGIDRLPALTHFSIQCDPECDLSPLGDASRLRYIKVEGGAAADPAVFTRLPNLRFLEIDPVITQSAIDDLRKRGVAVKIRKTNVARGRPRASRPGAG